MGLEMIAGDRRASIGHREEALMSLSSGDLVNFPELNIVWLSMSIQN